MYFPRHKYAFIFLALPFFFFFFIVVDFVIHLNESAMGKLCSAINYLAQCVLVYIHLFATAWTIAHQAPLSMEFSKQQY